MDGGASQRHDLFVKASISTASSGFRAWFRLPDLFFCYQGLLKRLFSGLPACMVLPCLLVIFATPSTLYVFY
jgi:hypothetical protein